MAAVLVIDASVAVRLVTNSCGQEDWGAQLEQAALVPAPELMLTDVANALWKLRRSNALNTMDPQALLADAWELVDAIEPDRTLQVEALARREAAALLTAEQKLRHLASHTLP